MSKTKTLAGTLRFLRPFNPNLCAYSKLRRAPIIRRAERANQQPGDDLVTPKALGKTQNFTTFHYL